MHFLNLVGLIKRELTLLNEIKPEIDAQLILDRDEKKKMQENGNLQNSVSSLSFSVFNTVNCMTF